MANYATWTTVGQGMIMSALQTRVPFAIDSAQITPTLLACTGDETATNFSPPAYIATAPVLSSSQPTSNTLRFELSLDTTVGTFTVGTIGLFSAGVLVALAAFPSAGQKVASNLPTIMGNVRKFYIDLVYAQIASAITSLPATSTFTGTFIGGYGTDALANAGALAIPHTLVNGDAYWNTVSNSARVYSGGVWVAADSMSTTSIAATYTASLVGIANFSPMQTLVDGATITFDAHLGRVARVTLTGVGQTLSLINFASGGSYVLYVEQDAVGARTITTWTNCKWSGGVAPTLTATANAIDVISFTSDGTYLYGVVNYNFH